MVHGHDEEDAEQQIIEIPLAAELSSDFLGEAQARSQPGSTTPIVEVAHFQGHEQVVVGNERRVETPIGRAMEIAIADHARADGREQHVAAHRRGSPKGELSNFPDRPPYAPLNAQEVVNRRAFCNETVCLPLRHTRTRHTHTCPPALRIKRCESLMMRFCS